MVKKNSYKSIGIKIWKKIIIQIEGNREIFATDIDKDKRLITNNDKVSCLSILFNVILINKD